MNGRYMVNRIKDFETRNKTIHVMDSFFLTLILMEFVDEGEWLNMSDDMLASVIKVKIDV